LIETLTPTFWVESAMYGKENAMALCYADQDIRRRLVFADFVRMAYNRQSVKR
jgi:hypothetical protein